MNDDANSRVFELGFSSGHTVALDAVVALLQGRGVVDKNLVAQVNGLRRKASVAVPLGGADEEHTEPPMLLRERRA